MRVIWLLIVAAVAFALAGCGPVTDKEDWDTTATVEAAEERDMPLRQRALEGMTDR